jgi:hypothetical protein
LKGVLHDLQALLFAAVPAFAAWFPSVKSAFTQAAQESPKQADFLFVQTAKGMVFDRQAGS